MRVSVVTVSFNAAETIEDTLRSVAAQTHADVEHIVVDGGSTDGTREILERWRDRLGKVIIEKDDGLYDAMNKGIRNATGDVVATLNADDVYADKNVLADVAKVFADPAVEATYGDLVYVKRDNIAHPVRLWRAGEMRDGAIAQGWHPPHPTFMVRRGVYERCGLFRLDYPLASDIELMVRMLGRHQVKAAYIPRVLVRMRMGGISNRRFGTVIEQNLWVLRAYKHNGVPRSHLLLLHKLFDRVGQFARARLGLT